jgi:TetR/AcrR family transcriptional repressor of mexJK operon
MNQMMSPEQLEPTEDEPVVKAGRPRASEAEARLQDLLNTAGDLFHEKGYSKCSLELIAREARVAVRTIYVKFGGKAGLFKALIMQRKEEYFAKMEDMEHSKQPIRDILVDFADCFNQLVSSPGAIGMYQIVIAEAHHNPELAEAFFDAGPRQTREMLARFFARPDIRAQIRDDVPEERLPVHLLNCITGDQLKRFLFESRCGIGMDGGREQIELGVDLFLRSVLR